METIYNVKLYFLKYDENNIVREEKNITVTGTAEDVEKAMNEEQRDGWTFVFRKDL